MTTLTRALAGLLCATIATTAGPGTAAAQPLTADHAVEIALKHNSQIVTSEADILDAKGGVYSSASAMLPRVSASYGRSGSLTTNSRGVGSRINGSQVVSGQGSTDFESYSTVPLLSGSWNILDLSSLSGFSAARSNLKAAQLQRHETRNIVILDTRRRFYDVVTAEHIATVSGAALRVSRDDERRVRALFEVGSVSRSDVLKSQVRTAQSELDSLTAVQNITATRVTLAQQIGVAEAQLGDIDTVLTAEPQTYDEAALLAEAVKNRPDIAAAEATVRAAGASVNAARFQRLPYVTVSGSVGINSRFSQVATTTFDSADVHVVFPPQGSSSQDDREWRGQVALNLDLFNGLTVESQSASARARWIRARENRDALRRNLTSEVHGTLLIYREAIERVAVAQRADESAAENLNLTQQKYNVGSATILELIDAEVQLQRALGDDVSARAQLRVAEAQIELVRGSGR